MAVQTLYSSFGLALMWVASLVFMGFVARWTALAHHHAPSAYPSDFAIANDDFGFSTDRKTVEDLQRMCALACVVAAFFMVLWLNCTHNYIYWISSIYTRMREPLGRHTVGQLERDEEVQARSLKCKQLEETLCKKNKDFEWLEASYNHVCFKLRETNVQKGELDTDKRQTVAQLQATQEHLERSQQDCRALSKENQHLMHEFLEEKKRNDSLERQLRDVQRSISCIRVCELTQELTDVTVDYRLLKRQSDEAKEKLADNSFYNRNSNVDIANQKAHTAKKNADAAFRHAEKADARARSAEESRIAAEDQARVAKDDREAAIEQTRAAEAEVEIMKAELKVLQQAHADNATKSAGAAEEQAAPATSQAGCTKRRVHFAEEEPKSAKKNLPVAEEQRHALQQQGQHLTVDTSSVFAIPGEAESAGLTSANAPFTGLASSTTATIGHEDTHMADAVDGTLESPEAPTTAGAVEQEPPPPTLRGLLGSFGPFINQAQLENATRLTAASGGQDDAPMADAPPPAAPPPARSSAPTRPSAASVPQSPLHSSLPRPPPPPTITATPSQRQGPSPFFVSPQRPPPSSNPPLPGLSPLSDSTSSTNAARSPLENQAPPATPDDQGTRAATDVQPVAPKGRPQPSEPQPSESEASRTAPPATAQTAPQQGQAAARPAPPPAGRLPAPETTRQRREREAGRSAIDAIRQSSKKTRLL